MVLTTAEPHPSASAPEGTTLKDQHYTVVDSPKWHILSWISTGLQVLGILVLLSSYGLQGSWSAAMMLTLSLVFLVALTSVPSLLRFMVIAAGTMNMLAIFLNAFTRLFWFDKLLHFYSTFAVVSALGFAIGSRQFGTISFAWFVTMGLLVGGAWEVLEASIIPQPWADTIADLTFDTLGAMLAMPFTWWAAGSKSNERI